MDNDKDRQFKREAIQLLDGNLAGLDSSTSEKKSGIDRTLVLQMYFESKSIVQQNVEEHMLSMVANDVLGTCIRVARCVYLENEEAKQTIINGKLTYLDLNSLYSCAKKEFEHMNELIEKY